MSTTDGNIKPGNICSSSIWGALQRAMFLTSTAAAGAGRWS